MPIESERYRKEEEILMTDPIIIALADGVKEGEGPEIGKFDFESWDFISRASEEYKKQGGGQARSIGGPARAIKRLCLPDAPRHKQNRGGGLR